MEKTLQLGHVSSFNENTESTSSKESSWQNQAATQGTT